jgi:hypothetical protein
LFFGATTKGTSVYATNLSVFLHECRGILEQSCRDCKIERHVLNAMVLGNYWPENQMFTASRVYVLIKNES